MTENAPMIDARDRDVEAEALDRAVAQAREAVARGRVVPHERVRVWLLDLARGHRTPRPRPE
jgi:predicted transcriptional regulator